VSEETPLQKESRWVNELNGVVAFLSGALDEISKCTDLESAKVVAEMASGFIAEYHAGQWTPGPIDDPSAWRPK
jgi:hypothetical protein